MTDLKKLHDVSLYDPNESSVMAEQTQCLELLYEYNMTRPSEAEKRKDLLKKNVCGDWGRLLYRATIPRKLGWTSCPFRQNGVRKFQSDTGR